MRFLVCLVFALATAWAQTEDPGDLPEFIVTIETNLTRIPVMVLGGRPNRALTAEDFELYEDGRRQEITYFESGPDMTLGLVIDCTSSMNPSMAQARAAAESVLDGMSDRDHVFIVVFGNNRRPRLLVPPTSNLKKAKRAVRKVHAYGGVSHVWDAVNLGLAQLEDVQGKSALVLISDGDDQTSKLPLKMLRQRLAAGHVPFHFIGLNVQSLTNRRTVESLAGVSGGAVRHAERPDELRALLAQIVTTVQDQYLLGYAPNRPKRRGVRRIEVRPADDVKLRLEWRRTVGSDEDGS